MIENEVGTCFMMNNRITVVTGIIISMVPGLRFILCFTLPLVLRLPPNHTLPVPWVTTVISESMNYRLPLLITLYATGQVVSVNIPSIFTVNRVVSKYISRIH